VLSLKRIFRGSFFVPGHLFFEKVELQRKKTGLEIIQAVFEQFLTIDIND